MAIIREDFWSVIFFRRERWNAAEMLKSVDSLRLENIDEAILDCENTKQKVLDANEILNDNDLLEIEELLETYCNTLREGPNPPDACDCNGTTDFQSAIGLCDGSVLEVKERDSNDGITVIQQLLGATHLVPRKGCSMVAISSGTVGESSVIPGSQSECGFEDPIPDYMGYGKTEQNSAASICDLKQLELKLQAPEWAKSFSFDFMYISAEYPAYLYSQYNDTFYAILESDSTNDGHTTNISFDANSNSIEVNNNFFENEFRPCTLRGTGFEGHGTTCWLRTSWPVDGGDEFTLTFSIHDEGDGIYSSIVLIDNFRWNDYEAPGVTDPLN